MTLDQDAWKAAVRPAAVLARIEARLVAAGAITELRQLHGMSAQEQDVLVWLELHEPLVSEDVQRTRPTAAEVHTRNRDCPSGCPQTTRRTMAA